MRVRVAYTVEVTDEYRRAIRRYYGQDGLATREEVARWHRSHGDAMDADLMWDHGDEDDNEGSS